MVQLGFNTGIAGVTKPTQVVAESKKPIPVVPVKKTKTIGVLHPKTSDDDSMVALGIDLFTQTKPGDVIINEYSKKLSSDAFDRTVSIARDISQGSGKQELIKAYPGITPDVIIDLHDANDSLVNPKKEPGVVTNTAAGFLSQLPKMATNILSMMVKGPQAPGFWISQIQKLNGGEGMNDVAAKQVDELGIKAQKEVTKFIGADETTKMYKLGQIVAEVAPFFVMPALGGEELGAQATQKITSKVMQKLPSLTKFIQNQLTQRVLQKSISSVPSSEAMAILGEGKPATPGQLLGGAFINTLIPGGTQSKINKLKNIVGEQQTKKGVAAATEIGNIEDVGAIKKRWNGMNVKVKATPKTLQSIAAIQKELPEIPTKPAELLDKLLGKMDNVKNKRVGGGVYEKVNKDYDSMLESVNISTMTKAKADIKNKISGMLQNAADFIPKTMKREISKVIDAIGNAKTLKDIRTANIKANSFFTTAMKSGKSNNPLEQNIYKIWKPLQDDLNTFIDTTAKSQNIIGTSEARATIAAIKHATTQIKNNSAMRGKTSLGMKQRIKRLGTTLAKLRFLGKVLGSAGVEKTGVAE